MLAGARDKPANPNMRMPGTMLIIAVVLLVFAMAALALRLLDASNPTVARGASNSYEACDSLLTEGERFVLRGTGPGPGRRVPALCEGTAGGRCAPGPGAEPQRAAGGVQQDQREAR